MIDAVFLVAKELAREGLQNGTLQIVGSVVRYVSGPHRGEIHSHLQPTSASDPTQQAILRLDGLQNGQQVMQGMLGQLSGGISALQVMSGLNLALSVVDIGISVAGFALMNAKLNAVQSAIGEVSRGIGFIRQDAIERDFIRLRGLAEVYENSWHLSDERRALPLLLGVATGAGETQLLMEHHAQRLLAEGLERLPAADRMLDGMALTLGLRISAAMAANESGLARHIADDGARRIEALTGAIGRMDLVRAALPAGIDPSSGDWAATLDQVLKAAEPLIVKLRTREANAATRSAPLRALEAHGVRPRDWLTAARSEKQEPVLLLAGAQTSGSIGVR